MNFFSYMKERYSKPEMAPVDFLVESALLKGSVTDKPILVQDVTVEDFKNGFGTSGFEELNFD